MVTEQIDNSSIVESLRTANNSVALWNLIHQIQQEQSTDDSKEAVLDGLEAYVNRQVLHDDQVISAILRHMPPQSPDFEAEVVCKLIHTICVHDVQNNGNRFEQVMSDLPSQQHPLVSETVLFAQALCASALRGIDEDVIHHIKMITNANAAFTRVLLNETKRGRRPPEEAFTRAAKHVAFLTKVNEVVPGLFNSIVELVRNGFHLDAIDEQHKRNAKPQQRMPKSYSDGKHDDVVAEANNPFHDEVHDHVAETRVLPVGQRRLVLLDLMEKYPNSVWPYVELSAVMPRAQDNIEMADKGLSILSRYQSAHLGSDEGRYWWQQPHAQLYIKLMLNKSRGLLYSKRVEDAIQLLDEMIDLYT